MKRLAGAILLLGSLCAAQGIGGGGGNGTCASCLPTNTPIANGVVKAVVIASFAPVSVTPIGISGSTTYDYCASELVLGQEPTSCQDVSQTEITNGNATLSGSNYNAVSNAQACVYPATDTVQFYRVTGGAQQGAIGSAIACSPSGESINDTGLTADGRNVPNVNGTGAIWGHHFDGTCGGDPSNQTFGFMASCAGGIEFATMLGWYAQTESNGATAIGSSATANGVNSTALGYSDLAFGDNTTVIGGGSTATVAGATVVGEGAGASANCVAIGLAATCSVAGAVQITGTSMKLGTLAMLPSYSGTVAITASSTALQAVTNTATITGVTTAMGCFASAAGTRDADAFPSHAWVSAGNTVTVEVTTRVTDASPGSITYNIRCQ